MGTARPQLGQALALGAVTSTPGSWDATLLRSGATLATTTTTSAGTETTASSRGASGMAAPECATNLATGTLRNSATWEWTATTVGWATIARISPPVDVLLQVLAAITAALALALAPALNLTPWSATPPRSIATLVWTRRAAGWVTGARTRAWGAALHPWEDQRWPLVRMSAPTRLILRNAVAVRSLVTQASPTRDAGSETTALIP